MVVTIQIYVWCTKIGRAVTTAYSLPDTFTCLVSPGSSQPLYHAPDQCHISITLRLRELLRRRSLTLSQTSSHQFEPSKGKIEDVTSILSQSSKQARMGVASSKNSRYSKGIGSSTRSSGSKDKDRKDRFFHIHKDGRYFIRRRRADGLITLFVFERDLLVTVEAYWIGFVDCEEERRGKWVFIVCGSYVEGEGGGGGEEGEGWRERAESRGGGAEGDELVCGGDASGLGHMGKRREDRTCWIAVDSFRVGWI